MTNPRPPDGSPPDGPRARSTRRADRRRRVLRVGVLVGAALGACAVGVATAAVLVARDDATVDSQATVRAPTATTTVTSPLATGPPRPCRHPLTPDAPLRLWIAGDSIAYSVGNGLGRKAAATGVVAPVYESHVSSSLGSPGFFDWPRRINQEVPRLDPEIVVFVMGTNDWAVPQATPVDAAGAPAWKAKYAKHVQTVVDALATDGRTLYWLGPPVLRDTKQEAGGREVADVIRSVVEADPDAVFVDAHDLLDGDDGSYTATVDVDGKRTQVRTADGVHFTEAGGDYLGAMLLDALDAQCRLRAQAVAGERQPLVETRGSTSFTPSTTGGPAPAGTSPPTASPTAPPTTTPATSPPVTATPTTPTTSPTPTAPPSPTTPTVPSG